jgi:hypothetical protein
MDVTISGYSTCASPSLSAGLNLIGHPALPPGLGCYALLNALGDVTASSVQRFNTTDGRFETCDFYDDGVNAPIPSGVDYPIVAGEGYVVYGRVPDTMQLSGCAP